MSTIGISSFGNILTVNGKSANAVNSVGGSVTDGNLKITVNGVESGDIPLPKSELPKFNIISGPSIEIKVAKISFASSDTIDNRSVVGGGMRNSGEVYNGCGIAGFYAISMPINATGDFKGIPISGDTECTGYPGTIIANTSITDVDFSVNLEDGEYILYIDKLMVRPSSIVGYRISDYAYDEENTTLKATVSNKIMTIESMSLNIDTTKFKTIKKNASFNSITLFYDRIKKVN